MSTRKTANDVANDLSVVAGELNAHEQTIYRKTDELQASVNGMKGWLLAGLTTIIASLFTLIIRGMV